MSAAPHSFASRLRGLREQHRMSKTRLGQEVGVSTTCVWNWEEGNTEPRSENLAALAKVLGVTTEFLEIGKGSKPSDTSDGVVEQSSTDESHEMAEALAPLTIAEAKVRLALGLGVPESAIEISVRY